MYLVSRSHRDMEFVAIIASLAISQDLNSKETA